MSLNLPYPLRVTVGFCEVCKFSCYVNETVVSIYDKGNKRNHMLRERLRSVKARRACFCQIDESENDHLTHRNELTLAANFRLRTRELVAERARIAKILAEQEKCSCVVKEGWVQPVCKENPSECAIGRHINEERKKEEKKKEEEEELKRFKGEASENEEELESTEQDEVDNDGEGFCYKEEVDEDLGLWPYCADVMKRTTKLVFRAEIDHEKRLIHLGSGPEISRRTLKVKYGKFRVGGKKLGHGMCRLITCVEHSSIAARRHHNPSLVERKMCDSSRVCYVKAGEEAGECHLCIEWRNSHLDQPRGDIDVEATKFIHEGECGICDQCKMGKCFVNGGDYLCHLCVVKKSGQPKPVGKFEIRMLMNPYIGYKGDHKGCVSVVSSELHRGNAVENHILASLFKMRKTQNCSGCTEFPPIEHVWLECGEVWRPAFLCHKCFTTQSKSEGVVHRNSKNLKKIPMPGKAIAVGTNFSNSGYVFMGSFEGKTVSTWYSSEKEGISSEPVAGIYINVFVEGGKWSEEEDHRDLFCGEGGREKLVRDNLRVVVLDTNLFTQEPIPAIKHTGVVFVITDTVIQELIRVANLNFLMRFLMVNEFYLESSLGLGDNDILESVIANDGSIFTRDKDLMRRVVEAGKLVYRPVATTLGGTSQSWSYFVGDATFDENTQSFLVSDVNVEFILGLPVNVKLGNKISFPLDPKNPDNYVLEPFENSYDLKGTTMSFQDVNDFLHGKQHTFNFNRVETVSEILEENKNQVESVMLSWKEENFRETDSVYPVVSEEGDNKPVKEFFELPKLLREPPPKRREFTFDTTEISSYDFIEHYNESYASTAEKLEKEIDGFSPIKKELIKEETEVKEFPSARRLSKLMFHLSQYYNSRCNIEAKNYRGEKKLNKDEKYVKVRMDKEAKRGRFLMTTEGFKNIGIIILRTPGKIDPEGQFAFRFVWREEYQKAGNWKVIGTFNGFSVGRRHTMTLNKVIFLANLYGNTITTRNGFYPELYNTLFCATTRIRVMISLQKFYCSSSYGSLQKLRGLLKKYLSNPPRRPEELWLYRRWHEVISSNSGKQPVSSPFFSDSVSVRDQLENCAIYGMSYNKQETRSHQQAVMFKGVSENSSIQSIDRPSEYPVFINEVEKKWFSESALRSAIRHYLSRSDVAGQRSYEEWLEVINSNYYKFSEGPKSGIDDMDVSSGSNSLNTIVNQIRAEQVNGSSSALSMFDFCLNTTESRGYGLAALESKNQSDKTFRETGVQTFCSKGVNIIHQSIFEIINSSSESELVSMSEKEKLDFIQSLGSADISVNDDMAGWSPTDEKEKFKVVVRILEEEGYFDEETASLLLRSLAASDRLKVFSEASSLTDKGHLKAWKRADLVKLHPSDDSYGKDNSKIAEHLRKKTFTDRVEGRYIKDILKDPKENIKDWYVVVTMMTGWMQGLMHHISSFVHDVQMTHLKNYLEDRWKSINLKLRYGAHSDDKVVRIWSSRMTLKQLESVVTAIEYHPNLFSLKQSDSKSSVSVRKGFIYDESELAEELAEKLEKLRRKERLRGFKLTLEHEWEELELTSKLRKIDNKHKIGMAVNVSEFVSIYSVEGNMYNPYRRQGEVLKSMASDNPIDNHFSIIGTLVNMINLSMSTSLAETMYSMTLRELSSRLGNGCEFEEGLALMAGGKLSVSLLEVRRFGLQADTLNKILRGPENFLSQLATLPRFNYRGQKRTKYLRNLETKVFSYALASGLDMQNSITKFLKNEKVPVEHAEEILSTYTSVHPKNNIIIGVERLLQNKGQTDYQRNKVSAMAVTSGSKVVGYFVGNMRMNFRDMKKHMAGLPQGFRDFRNDVKFRILDLEESSTCLAYLTDAVKVNFKSSNEIIGFSRFRTGSVDITTRVEDILLYLTKTEDGHCAERFRHNHHLMKEELKAFIDNFGITTIESLVENRYVWEEMRLMNRIGRSGSFQWSGFFRDQGQGVEFKIPKGSLERCEDLLSRAKWKKVTGGTRRRVEIVIDRLVDLLNRETCTMLKKTVTKTFQTGRGRPLETDLTEGVGRILAVVKDGSLFENVRMPMEARMLISSHYGMKINSDILQSNYIMETAYGSQHMISRGSKALMHYVVDRKNKLYYVLGHQIPEWKTTANIPDDYEEDICELPIPRQVAFGRCDMILRADFQNQHPFLTKTQGISKKYKGKAVKRDGVWTTGKGEATRRFVEGDFGLEMVDRDNVVVDVKVPVTIRKIHNRFAGMFDVSEVLGQISFHGNGYVEVQPGINSGCDKFHGYPVKMAPWFQFLTALGYSPCQNSHHNGKCIDDREGERVFCTRTGQLTKSSIDQVELIDESNRGYLNVLKLDVGTQDIRLRMREGVLDTITEEVWEKIMSILRSGSIDELSVREVGGRKWFVLRTGTHEELIPVSGHKEGYMIKGNPLNLTDEIITHISHEEADIIKRCGPNLEGMTDDETEVMMNCLGLPNSLDRSRKFWGRDISGTDIMTIMESSGIESETTWNDMDEEDQISVEDLLRYEPEPVVIIEGMENLSGVTRFLYCHCGGPEFLNQLYSSLRKIGTYPNVGQQSYLVLNAVTVSNSIKELIERNDLRLGEGTQKRINNLRLALTEAIRFKKLEEEGESSSSSPTRWYKFFSKRKPKIAKDKFDESKYDLDKGEFQSLTRNVVSTRSLEKRPQGPPTVNAVSGLWRENFPIFDQRTGYTFFPVDKGLAAELCEELRIDRAGDITTLDHIIRNIGAKIDPTALLAVLRDQRETRGNARRVMDVLMEENEESDEIKLSDEAMTILYSFKEDYTLLNTNVVQKSRKVPIDVRFAAMRADNETVSFMIRSIENDHHTVNDVSDFKWIWKSTTASGYNNVGVEFMKSHDLRKGKARVVRKRPATLRLLKATGDCKELALLEMYASANKWSVPSSEIYVDELAVEYLG